MFKSGTIIDTNIIEKAYKIKLININDITTTSEINLLEKFKESLEPSQDKLLERFQESLDPKKSMNMEIFFSVDHIDNEGKYLSNLENDNNSFPSELLYIYRP